MAGLSRAGSGRELRVSQRKECASRASFMHGAGGVSHHINSKNELEHDEHE